MDAPTQILLGSSLASSVLYGIYARSPCSPRRTIAKTASTALLSILVGVRQGGGGPRLLITALALGATGDAFLAWDEGETAFLCGLASFLVAHVLYIVLFVREGSNLDLILSENWRICMAALLIVLAAGMVVRLMPRVGSDLRVPVLVYSVAILTMVIAALSLDNIGATLGAIIFTFSDAVLAADRFLISASSSHRVWMPYVVWILYYSGQMLLALSLGFSGA